MSMACTSASLKNTMVRMSSSAPSSEQIFTSFFSKVGQRITDYTHYFMKNIEDFKLSLEALKKSSKVLNAKASEVEEQIKFPKGSCQKKRKRDVGEWLTRVKSIENEVVELGNQVDSEGFIRNLVDGGKVAQLNENIVMLVEQSQHFDELHLDPCGIRGVELLTTMMVGEASDENFKKIWDFLEKREVLSIGIHGMGGVGKTALAKCINNKLLKQSQAHVLWITVSHEFTIKSLQDKIACYIGVNLLDGDDVEIRAAKLHSAISRMKNLVVILDDLWEFIDLVKVGCRVSVECCRLIITTRSLEVCHQMQCQEIVKVKRLSDDEAWKLFVGTLGSGEEIELGPDVEEIAKSMACLCDGLPLGIINLARSMRGKTSTQSWNIALSELVEPVTRPGGIWDVEVARVLKYSFDRLNNQSHSNEFNSFQLCFLYCSLFPQNNVGERNEVVERFISEGLIDGGKSRRAQIHQGHSIMDYLVNVCLLEDIDGYESYDGCVKMHYLVRRMALKICEGKYMVRAGVRSFKEIPIEKEWTEDLEKVSFMRSGLCNIRDGVSPNCPNLLTLLLNETPLWSIPGSLFSKMKRLTYIDLSRTQISVLPESLCNFTSLESLLLGYCGQLKTVPYLGKLKALRELDLSYTPIKAVPQGVEELFSLQFLSMESSKLKTLHSDLLLKLRHLQHVKFPIKVEIPTGVWNLQELEQLHGRLNNVIAFNNFINRKPLRDALYQVQVGEYYSDDEDLLEDHDREVFLSKCSLRYEKLLGGNIQSLRIRDCEGMSSCLLDDFAMPSHPMSLKILRIEECKGTSYISRSSGELTSPLLSNLELIELEALEDFKGLVQQGEVGAVAVFSSLKSLRIVDCCWMKSVGLPVTGFPNLEDIHISDCGRVEKIFEDEGRGAVILPNLIRLQLFSLPRLQSICKATMFCDTIRAISVSGCPRLAKKLPLHVDVPLVLKTIKVEREWWESLEWEDPNLSQVLQPIVHFF